MLQNCFIHINAVHFLTNSNILSRSFSWHSVLPCFIIICKLLISTHRAFQATNNLFDFIVINLSSWNLRRPSRVHFHPNTSRNVTTLNK
jgi:hypothetical protein